MGECFDREVNNFGNALNELHLESSAAFSFNLISNNRYGVAVLLLGNTCVA